MEHFNKLNSINVNEKVEEKNKLKYLSWAWAWAETKKVYPDARYEVKKFDGKPFIYDKELGYMVFTEVTIEGLTHEMWLPVMDGANKSMKDHEYTYEVNKYEYDYAQRKKVCVGKEQKTVEQATMFDINKTIMRCLTKNLAMFGLGLYIYAGEDLPEETENKGENSSEVKEDKQTPINNQNNAENEPKTDLTLEQALQHKVKVIDDTGAEFILTVKDVYKLCKSKIPDLIKNGDAITVRAFELAEAERIRKNEENKKKTMDKLNEVQE